MKQYKQPKSILQHARDFLANPNHWAQSTLATCVVPGAENDETPLAKQVRNEECAYCVLGAVRAFSDSSIVSGNAGEYRIVATPAGEFLEAAARSLYGDAEDNEAPADEHSVAVSVNDGEKHKTPYGAYNATLRILDKAIEWAKEGKKVELPV